MIKRHDVKSWVQSSKFYFVCMLTFLTCYLSSVEPYIVKLHFEMIRVAFCVSHNTHCLVIPAATLIREAGIPEREKELLLQAGRLLITAVLLCKTLLLNL